MPLLLSSFVHILHPIFDLQYNNYQLLVNLFSVLSISTTLCGSVNHSIHTVLYILWADLWLSGFPRSVCDINYLAS